MWFLYKKTVYRIETLWRRRSRSFLLFYVFRVHYQNITLFDFNINVLISGNRSNKAMLTLHFQVGLRKKLFQNIGGLDLLLKTMGELIFCYEVLLRYKNFRFIISENFMLISTWIICWKHPTNSLKCRSPKILKEFPYFARDKPTGLND